MIDAISTNNKAKEEVLNLIKEKISNCNKDKNKNKNKNSDNDFQGINNNFFYNNDKGLRLSHK